MLKGCRAFLQQKTTARGSWWAGVPKRAGNAKGNLRGKLDPPVITGHLLKSFLQNQVMRGTETADRDQLPAPYSLVLPDRVPVLQRSQMFSNWSPAPSQKSFCKSDQRQASLFGGRGKSCRRPWKCVEVKKRLIELWHQSRGLQT